MKVFLRANKILLSNTYILSKENIDEVYIIDPGDSEPILNWLNSNKKTLVGIFLTHAHFDHIYGLNDLLGAFSNCKLYVSSLMINGLFSIKLNTSLYHEKPYVLKKCYSKNIVIIEGGYGQKLWNEESVYIISTPGHTNDCVSINISNYLFSGDALIPGIKVYSRKRMSDYNAISASLELIYSKFPSTTILLPGHGKDILLGKSKSLQGFCKIESKRDFIEIQKQFHEQFVAY